MTQNIEDTITLLKLIILIEDTCMYKQTLVVNKVDMSVLKAPLQNGQYNTKHMSLVTHRKARRSIHSE